MTDIKFKNILPTLPEKKQGDGGIFFPEEVRGKTYFIKKLNAIVRFSDNGATYSDPIPITILEAIDFKSLIQDEVDAYIKSITDKLKEFEKLINNTVTLATTVQDTINKLDKRLIELENDPTKMTLDDVKSFVIQSLKENGPKIVQKSIQDEINRLDKPKLNLMEMSMAERMGVKREEYMEMIKNGFDVDVGFNKGLI